MPEANSEKFVLGLSSKTEKSIKDRMTENAKFLKSPLVLFYLISYLCGNFIVMTSLSLMNELLRHKVVSINEVKNATIIEFDATLNIFNFNHQLSRSMKSTKRSDWSLSLSI